MCLISLLQQGVQAGDEFEIEDKNWKAHPANYETYEFPFTEIFQQRGIVPLTAELAAKEVEDFKRNPRELKIKQIKSSHVKLSLLVCFIGSSAIGDHSRKLLKAMIWNRILLFRTMTDSTSSEEELPSVKTLYSNLSEIEKQTVDTLSSQTTPENLSEFLNSYFPEDLRGE